MTILIEQEDKSLMQVNVADGVDEAVHAELLANGRRYEIAPLSEIPIDRTFQDAWELDTSASNQYVVADMTMAKNIAHTARREARDAAFEPLDRQVTVPSLQAKAEESRRLVRDADAIKQSAIDSATDEAELLAAHNG